jgi:hypothetical protein
MEIWIQCIRLNIRNEFSFRVDSLLTCVIYLSFSAKKRNIIEESKSFCSYAILTDK